MTLRTAYLRVFPRDLFNEGNLLKCLGRLYLLLDVMHRKNVRFSVHNTRTIDIAQDDADGSLTILNVHLVVGLRMYVFKRPLNSRDKWPLYIQFADDVFCVFDDNGELSSEFHDLIKGIE